MATKKSFQKLLFLFYLWLVKSKLWFTSIWVWAIFGRSHWMLSRWLSCRLNYFLFFILVNLNLCRVRNLRNRRLHLFSHLVLARRRHVARRTAGVASWRRQVWRARRIRPRFILFISIKWLSLWILPCSWSANSPSGAQFHVPCTAWSTHSQESQHKYHQSNR